MAVTNSISIKPHKLHYKYNPLGSADQMMKPQKYHFLSNLETTHSDLSVYCLKTSALPRYLKILMLGL